MNILITGGTSGLGYRTAHVLGKEIKNKIILIGSNQQKGELSVEIYFRNKIVSRKIKKYKNRYSN